MDDVRPLPAPKAWLDDLDCAEADLAAGRVFDGTAVRQRLRDSIKQMQDAERAKAAQGR